MVKICSLCEIEKSLDEFHKFIHSKDGYRNRCKECRKSITKKYREENADRVRESQKRYREENKELVKQRKKEYYENNREKVLEKNKEWRENNPDYNKEYLKNYYQQNRSKLLEKSKQWKKDNPNYMSDYMKKYKKDNKARFVEYGKSDKYKEWKNEYTKKHREKYPHIYAWRTILNNTIKRFGTSKEDTTNNLLGYSAEQLKLRLECQFKDGICWENYGEWHIDHKKPVSSFPPDTDMSIVNALSNLQPLWAYDNLSKGNSTK